MNLPPTQPTRKDLIRRIREVGDERSWRELHAAYAGFVAGVAVKCGLPRDEADDVVSCVFAQVHGEARDGRLPDFAERSFGAWLATRVRWRVLDYHRQQRRQEQATVPDAPALNGCCEPFDQLWEAEWQRKLMTMALSRLPEKPRNLLIFQALAFHERPVEEVCREFGISRTNAETVKNRVKDKLAAEIARLEREGV